MTWKGTAVVSGAGLLATWLAAAPPAGVAPAPAPRAATSSRASDIEREADRLQVRVRSEVDYRAPSRNPFRFGERPAAAPRVAAPASNTPTFYTPPEPEPVRLKFSGMAADTVDGREVRTAILSTPTGLIFAKDGDAVDGFTVGTISEDAVELRKADGSVLQLR
jgi:hypothetical protein